MNQYFINDARKLRKLPLKDQVDLIITSPPYFDMKDYGSKNQIGFGQDYDAYLKDLRIVFKQCYSITKDTGSLWIIVDILRKEGEIKILPLDVIQKVQQSGWNLQDIIIWKKDKTVPFTHNGQMRNISEYILFFTKTKDFKFYRERVTSINDLKEWWQKYPERYSPTGKSPTNIWDFSIPLQGSWGNKYIKHFCPLPEGLIERIIHLCSDINDTIFDPFAGSGAVLSAAHHLNRNYIGSDLNEKYKEMFLQYIKKVKPVNIENMYSHDIQKQFSKTIIKLRVLKYPKKLYAILRGTDEGKDTSILGIIAQPKIDNNDIPKLKLISCEYIFILKEGEVFPSEAIDKLIKKAPLSKFGIDVKIRTSSVDSALHFINKQCEEGKLWRYDNGVTYKRGKYIEKLSKEDFLSNHNVKHPPIYSPVELIDGELTL